MVKIDDTLLKSDDVFKSTSKKRKGSENTNGFKNRLGASFRDPAGFLFEKQEVIYRQINKQYKPNYDLLVSSGLLERLTKENLLVYHKEIDIKEALTNDVYKIIQPNKIPFISYPYEWSFSQLKDAALTTLKIQKIALEHGMSLRDASAYNIQFFEGKPIFIDTLSFEKHEQKPWVAYKQFCQHFLAPLTLMCYVDIELGKLSKIYIDGIPLPLASRLLPLKTKIRLGLLIHLHIHASTQKKYSDKGSKIQNRDIKLSKRSLLGLVDSLEGAIKSLKWAPSGTEWGDYYQGNLNYLPNSLRNKANMVENLLNIAKPKSVWDLGGNTGLFSRVASDKGIFTVSSDVDPAAVEINYKTVVDNNESNLLPLLIDLTNPSPDIGWSNNERSSFIKRGPVDLCMALALVHHLAISNNVPLEKLAEFFSVVGKNLIVEFIPKEDSQVKKLLTTREDIFPDYTTKGFEKAFQEFFQIKKVEQIKGSKRTLYLMKRKDK